MKWTFFIKHKMAAAALLGIVIALVIFNNISEQKNSDELHETFSSLYEDRLLAESYILSMYGDLHEIDELSEQQPPASMREQTAVLNKIDHTIELYRATQLTAQEEIEFNAFVYLIGRVTADVHNGNYEASRISVSESLRRLSALSEIQVAEGTRLNNNSQRIHSEHSTSAQFELAMLVVIGVLIQALIFTTKTIQQAGKQKPSLN